MLHSKRNLNEYKILELNPTTPSTNDGAYIKKFGLLLQEAIIRWLFRSNHWPCPVDVLYKVHFFRFNVKTMILHGFVQRHLTICLAIYILQYVAVVLRKTCARTHRTPEKNIDNSPGEWTTIFYLHYCT